MFHAKDLLHLLQGHICVFQSKDLLHLLQGHIWVFQAKELLHLLQGHICVFQAKDLLHLLQGHICVFQAKDLLHLLQGHIYVFQAKDLLHLLQGHICVFQILWPFGAPIILQHFVFKAVETYSCLLQHNSGWNLHRTAHLIAENVNITYPNLFRDLGIVEYYQYMIF